MKYYLKSVGLEGKYAQMNSAAKKTFLESWFAQKLKETKAKLSSSSSKTVVNTTAAADDYFWASKQEMINIFGLEKTLNKIGKGS